MMQFRSPAEMVAEFQEVFETSSDPALWKKLVLEELAEIEQAYADVLKELVDFLYVTAGLLNVAGEEETGVFLTALEPRMERVNSLVDGGYLNRLIDEAFRRVHASNMSKLGDDGKPVRREDGKVLKGPNYQPPVLTDLITN